MIDESEIVSLLREAMGDHVRMKGEPQVQIDVSHYKALTGEQTDALARHGYFLVGDTSVTCAVRRLTFQIGGEPPLKPQPYSWPVGEATVIYAHYACGTEEGTDLCLQCTKRYRAILSMYGVAEGEVELALRGLFRRSLQGLCFIAQQRKDTTP